MCIRDSVNAPYFDGAKLLIAADCTAYAYAQMHNDFMRGKITLIGCPKPVSYTHLDVYKRQLLYNEYLKISRLILGTIW